MRLLPIRPARARRQHADWRYVRVAVLTILAIVLVTYYAFIKQLPWETHFTMRADVSSSNQLVPGSLVRIAAVNIGKVTQIDPGPHNTSIVTMEIDNPSELHSDTSLAIEPRLIFEGNFYVKVDPGTPAAPMLQSGATIPLSRTSVPVQIDQVLDVFDRPTRGALNDTVSQLASGLGPSPRNSSTRTPGFQGLRDAARQFSATLPSVTSVAIAAQGTQPGDLDRAIGSSAEVTSQLAQDPQALADLVTSYNRIFASLASSDGHLGTSVQALDQLTRRAPAELAAIDAALPSLTRFASTVRPALRSAPATLANGSRLLGQLHQLVSAPELPALLSDLQPVTTNLAPLEQQLDTLFPLLTSASQCVSHTVLPALEQKIPDGQLSTGQPAWQEILHMGANLAATSPGFDANGVTIRIGLANGPNEFAGELPGLGSVVTSASMEGVDPQWLGYGVIPPFRPDAPCTKQTLPDLSIGRSTGAPMALHASARPAGTSTAQRVAAFLTSPTADRTKLIDELTKLLFPSIQRARATGSRRTTTSAPTRTATAPRTNPAGSPSTPTTPPRPSTGAEANPVLQGVGHLLDKLTSAVLGRQQ